MATISIFLPFSLIGCPISRRTARRTKLVRHCFNIGVTTTPKAATERDRKTNIS
jgi:hypothetical protein